MPDAADHGEPWRGNDMRDGGRRQRFTVTREGRAVLRMVDGPAAVFGPPRSWEEHERVRLRVVACVNFLSGVPDAVLADPRAAAALWAMLAAMGHGRARKREGNPDDRR